MPIVIPIIRMYDYNKTVEFYVDWLDFTIDWKHEFEPGTPKFMQVSMQGIRLYLSEHHGDGSPGIHVTVDDFPGLEKYHNNLLAKNYKYNRPGIVVPEWDPSSISVTVIDPVGNQLTFNERIK